MKIIIIDFEFTGLDNSFINDNEICQLKYQNISNTQDYGVFNFNTKKKSSAGAILKHKIIRRSGKPFNKEFFYKLFPETEIKFVGFSTELDEKMLMKYDINIKIHDIKLDLMLSKFGNQMALEGSSLEACYYIVFKTMPEIQDHSNEKELQIINLLYLKTLKLKKNKYLELMPFGHCAGMPIADYIQHFRRAADGYRFNNNDILAHSLNAHIEEYEYSLEVMNDDEDEFDDDDEF